MLFSPSEGCGSPVIIMSNILLFVARHGKGYLRSWNSMAALFFFETHCVWRSLIFRSPLIAVRWSTLEYSRSEIMIVGTWFSHSPSFISGLKLLHWVRWENWYHWCKIVKRSSVLLVLVYFSVKSQSLLPKLFCKRARSVFVKSLYATARR